MYPLSTSVVYESWISLFNYYFQTLSYWTPPINTAGLPDLETEKTQKAISLCHSPWLITIFTLVLKGQQTTLPIVRRTEIRAFLSRLFRHAQILEELFMINRKFRAFLHWKENDKFDQLVMCPSFWAFHRSSNPLSNCSIPSNRVALREK